jgi:drug/metabolite transporter (DMT)-like permease
MRFKQKEHFFMALQGVFLFAINYWLFYVAELYVTSGLAAVVFSTIIFMNVVNSHIFLREPIRLRVVSGASIGLIGMGLVFWPELSSFSLEDRNFLGLLLCVLATFSASLGNITSAYNQKYRLPVVQTNTYGMTYGAIIMGVFALISGKPFTDEFGRFYGKRIYKG